MSAAPAPDRGSVTAETAVAMTGIVLLLGALLAVGAVVLTQVRLTDAAGAGARAAARGDAAAAVQEAAARVGGRATTVAVHRAGELVTVTAAAPVVLPLIGEPVLVVEASAVARVEVIGPGP